MTKNVYVRTKESTNDIYVGLHNNNLGETHLIESVAYELWRREKSKREIKELDGFIAKSNQVKHCLDKIVIILND